MSEHIAAFAAFWQFYREKRDTAVASSVQRSPALDRFYAAMDSELKQLFGPGLLDAAERTIAERTFEPLDAAQRAIGDAFARAGLTYNDVFVGLFAFRNQLLALIDQERSIDPQVQRGLLVYVQNAVLNIGSAFIATRDAMLAEQRAQIMELSVPVLGIAPRVLLVPLIGELVAERLTGLLDRVLSSVARVRARQIIIDCTGLAKVDAKTAGTIEQVVAACRLMGAEAIVCGLSGDVANVIADGHVELHEVAVVGDLSQAIERVLGSR